MVAKTGLVVHRKMSESQDRWKFDQPGTQILYYRGFTQTELVRIFFYLLVNLLTAKFNNNNTLTNKEIRAIKSPYFT